MQLSKPKMRAGAEAGTKKGRFYKPLPKEFRRDGFTHRQIARERDAAMYEHSWNGCSNPSVCYEVIRIRKREGFQIGSRFVARTGFRHVADIGDDLCSRWARAKGRRCLDQN